MDPTRTCLGCRQRAPRSALNRYVARDGVVVADPSKTMPGRGAWVHPTSDCMALVERRKAFGRALHLDRKAETTNGQLMSGSK